MITKDFPSAKDFPLIRGKSFAIMAGRNFGRTNCGSKFRIFHNFVPKLVETP